MKFDNWDYSLQGDFLRTDGLCAKSIVVEVDTPLKPIEPRTGLPTQFRSTTRHAFEMQSGCRAEGMSGCPGYSAVIFRTPDRTTPDQVALPIGGENLIQRLADGGIARWISWPPPWQSGREAWYGLWRIEYPDGRIERFLPEIYADANQAHVGYLQREQGSQGVSERQQDGSTVLRDGGGRPYARVIGNRFIPFALAIGTDRNTIRHEASFTGGQFRSLDWYTGDYQWAEQSAVYTDPDYVRLVQLSTLSVSAIAALRPSQVVQLYYSTGAWAVDDGKDWILAKYVGGLAPTVGASTFLMETMVRQRLYAFRPDLHQIALSDGQRVPGIINWAIFPPVDCIQCLRKPPTGFRAILDQVLVVASTLLVAAIPGIGGLAIGLGITYANARDKGKLLADAMSHAEAAGKYLSLAQGAQTGAWEIIAKDPPGATQAELEARANGDPTPFPATTPGNGGWMLPLVALAAVVLG